jgi:component factor B
MKLEPPPFTVLLPQRPQKGHENCMGAVVSEYFVLTAAHCFTVEDQKHSIKVSVGKDVPHMDSEL